MIDKEVKQTVINIFDDVDELMSENGKTALFIHELLVM